MTELSEEGADAKHGFGGDTLSTSVYITRQADPAALTVHCMTALGADNFSQQMLDAWYGEDIDTSLAQRMGNRLPGLYYVEIGSIGERTLYCQRNEAAAKFWLESEQSATIYEELVSFDYLYLSRISLAILSPTGRKKLLSLLRECRASGGKVIFDNSYRPRLQASKEGTQQVYQQMLECTDITFLALDDEDTLWDQQPVKDVTARTHNAGVKEVVMKCGAGSCLMSIAGEGLVDAPAVELPKEKVIGTTAADDSFSAGYLTVRLTGETTGDTAKRRHLTASTVIQYHGAITPREAIPA